MRVFYHSIFRDVELEPDTILRTIPLEANISLETDKKEVPYEIIFNGNIVDADISKFDCSNGAELIIRQSGQRYVYLVKPLFQRLTSKYGNTYKQFYDEYTDKEFNEIESIQLGQLKLYAVDQYTEIGNWSTIFDNIEKAFIDFKAICERPKSHLKSVNEIRPIETVKRIGYESIPYLASHSEDWLARTAGGLKPARLFSRVEDDEYHIYENRVVKTLIDNIISFLRKTEKRLRDQVDQLSGIMNSSVQTGSFGFDVTFQKAINELMSFDTREGGHNSKNLETIKAFQTRSYVLLKKYRTLRHSKLYKNLKKAKNVTNPLKETNILVLDRHYSVIFKLWKFLHRRLAPTVLKKTDSMTFMDLSKYYHQFCSTLCGYASHVLGFELDGNGAYIRTNDSISIKINDEEQGKIIVTISDIEDEHAVVPDDIFIPISSGEEKNGFRYVNNILYWNKSVSTQDINDFCSLLKSKDSRGIDQANEKRRYLSLKSFIEEAIRKSPKLTNTSFVIIPVAVDLSNEKRNTFKLEVEKLIDDFVQEKDFSEVVIGLPLCNENEQGIVEYAKEGQNCEISILSMFDINSFRRIQNLLYRHIVKLGKDTCPNCGGKMRKCDNQLICDNCNQLTVTKTICPNENCKREYTYMSYEVSEEIIEKMKEVTPEHFFLYDSLYQYKNIVNMKVEVDKVKTVCPYCHKG